MMKNVMSLSKSMSNSISTGSLPNSKPNLIGTKAV